MAKKIIKGAALGAALLLATGTASAHVNGTQINFDLGTATKLNNCSGSGGLTSGTCSPVFDALNVDGAIAATGFSSSTYGKYAIINLDPTELAGLGISAGPNAVTLTSFSPNVHWAGLNFPSATVPINIIVLPPNPGGNVPAPATLGLLGLGLAALGMSRRRSKK